MGISLNPATLLSGQGIDVASIVQQTLAQRSGSLTEWQQEQTTLSTQAGLLQGINNNLISLTSAVNALVDPSGALAALQATSSQPGILTATAQTSAAPGSHQIVVGNLATTSSAFTDSVTTGSFLTKGSFTLQVGSGAPATISVNASNVTLDALASYINTNVPSFGVTASVINDANGSRLSLISNTSGAPGNLTIVGGGNVGLTFHQVAGANASLTVDGAPISSPTNIVTGAIPGVTLNLASASATPVQVTVGTDPAQTTQAINSFVTAYNTLIQSIDNQFAVDPTSNTQGPLGADSSLRSLQSSVLADVTSSITGNSGLINLASLGIDLNNDGTLTVNETATDLHPSLSNVLAANPGAVQNFFQNASGTGFANNFAADLNNLTDLTQGVLTSDIAQNSAQAKSLTNSINNFQDQLTAEQTALTLELEQVNATLEAYPALLQQVTETLGSLPTSTTSGGLTGTSAPTLTSGL